MSSAAPKKRRGCGFLGGLLLLVLVAGGGLAAYTWVALHYTFSEGERAGYVQKFSHKGWICKTWEGELAMVNLPGATAEIFPFSVRDEAVAAKIRELTGRRTVLYYAQHRGLPTQCFGDTDYFVTDVKIVEP